MIPRHVYIVRHEDGSPSEIYNLPDVLDTTAVYRLRRARGITDPIGAVWGTSSELWVQTELYAVKVFPLFSDDLWAVNQLWRDLSATTAPTAAGASIPTAAPGAARNPKGV